MATLPSYATVDELKSFMLLTGTTDTTDPQKLLACLRTATAEIENFTQRTFFPWIAVRQFDWRTSYSVSFRTYDLLQLTSLTDGVGVVAPAAAIILLGGTTSGATDVTGPYYGLRVDPGKGAYLLFATTKIRAISVSGVWGYHDDYPNAWRGSGDAPTAPVGTTDTSIAVTNTAGLDAWGQSPRFSSGQLIQIDNEWLWITAVPDATHITVVRGQQGTTAATHLANAPISLYTPMADIHDVCLKWAQWLYTRSYTDGGQQGSSNGGGSRTADQTPAELEDPLRSYQNNWTDG